jgi:hypothetical protein
MADLPEPVDMTTSVSRPSSSASIASRWPGRSVSKPNVLTCDTVDAIRTAIAAGLPGPAQGETRLRSSWRPPPPHLG